MSLVEWFFESPNSNRRIVHAIARSLRVDAAEVESQTLSRLMRQTTADDVPFAAILRQCARSAAIDLRRHETRRPTVSLSETVQDASGDTYSVVIEPGVEPTILARLVAREALQTLSASERRAVLGSDMSGAARKARSTAKAKITKLLATR